MFDKILDLLAAAGTLLSPIVICHPWQGGVITRWGRFHRAITPGYYAKWPLSEDVVLAEACETTIRLPPQSLTTLDDRDINISCIVKYQIRDMRKFVCDVWDQKDVLADVTMGAIGECVRARTYQQVMHETEDAKAFVLAAVRKGVNRYGFQIYSVTFPDLTKGRSLRLILPNAKDLDN